MQACTWNVRGKRIQDVSDWMSLEYTPENITLQEAGGVHLLSELLVPSRGQSDEMQELAFGLDSDMHEYRVFVGSTDAHLSQVIAIDTDVIEHVKFSFIGKRVVGVCFQNARNKRFSLVLSVHFPHSGTSEIVFQEAVDEFMSIIQRYSQYDILACGDWNCEPGSSRYDTLAVPMTLQGGRFCSPMCPTRFGIKSSSTLDYIFIAGAWVTESHHMLQFMDAECMTVVKHSAEELQSDHACVIFDFALEPSSFLKCSYTRSRASIRQHSKCGRWKISTYKLVSAWPDCSSFRTMSSQRQWVILSGMAAMSSYRAPTRRYRDSATLKALCARRRLSRDTAERTALTRQILALRQLERDAWHRDLITKAANKDHEASKFLKHNRSNEKGHRFDEAFRAFSGRHLFTKAVQDFFVSRFQAQMVAPSQLLGSGRDVGDLPMANPFSIDEVRAGILRMQLNKCSGASGMSVEFLRALLHREDGLQLIADHLNTVLLQGTSLPEHRIAVLTLLPKLRDVCEPKDLRPIALMECAHKLYMSLLVGRIQATWPIPHFQQGGLPGTQLIDALFMFTNRLQRDALQLSHSIWVSADIEAAFDSVNWDKLRTTMFSLSSSQVHPELHRLLYEISSHGLLMEFQGLVAGMVPGKGILQGGSHSAQVFAILVEHIFRDLHTRWEQEFPGEVGAWAFIDDCIFVFSSWRVAERVVPWIIEAFADYGLRWNLSKTTVMSTSDMLRSGLGSLSLNHALRECTWSQTVRYLGISLQQPAFDSTEGCTLTELLLPQCKQRVMSGIVQMQSILNRGHWQRWDVSVDLIQTYIASRWLWLSPLLHPNREHLASLQSLQLSILCQTLKLYIPDWLSSSQAGGLNRLRRRAIREILRLRKPESLWTVAWLHRKHGYFGHLLRRQTEHLARQELLCPLHQQRPGRAGTCQRWVLRMCQKFFDSPTLNIEALSNLYVDKEQWLSFFPLVLQEHGLKISEHHSFHYDTWLRWRDPFLATTSWFRAVLFDYAPDDSWTFKWLCETSGWLELTFCGTVHSVLEQFIPHLLMLHGDLFVVQLLCPATVVALHGSLIPSSIHIHNLQRLPQLSLEGIRDDWALHVTSL